MVTEWARRRRRSTAASPDRPATILPVPPAQTIARRLTREHDCRSEQALRVRLAVETASPRIVAARNLLDHVRTVVADETADDLAAWLEEATGSEQASFASGIRDDEAGVQAAVVQPWSDGQAEGQVIRLKPVKRQMDGSADVDLLRARMVQPA